MVIAVTAIRQYFSRKFPHEFNEFVRNNGQDSRRDDPENTLHFRMRLSILMRSLDNKFKWFYNEMRHTKSIMNISRNGWAASAF